MQNDIHAPGTTVYEALEFSAQMRIKDVDKHQLKDFVDQVQTYGQTDEPAYIRSMTIGDDN